MEVCGGHTHTIYRHGIEHLLPETVELVHGPGCPVCVIPMGRIDDAMWLARPARGDLHLLRRHDAGARLARQPAGRQSQGADVRFVYSPLDALKIAVDNPDNQVVFFAIGFETTAPSTAVTLMRARDLGLANFSVFCNHVTIVPPIKAILESPDLRLSGFIGPGHVSTVVGNRPYRFVPEVYRKPLVVAGFEPLDILASVAMLLTQIREGRCEVENQYTRAVPEHGNPAALALMGKVFALRPHFEWRGLGFISQSALRLHDDYADFDAELRFAMPGVRVADPKACQCGEVLKGVLKPWECKVFGTACTPETPIGTCMVSPEGACAAYYNFGRLHRDAAKLVGRTDHLTNPDSAEAPTCSPATRTPPTHSATAALHSEPPCAMARSTTCAGRRRRFSGAWPYLRVLSTLTGIADPLDYLLVESYWLGGGVGADLDPHDFFDALLAIIGPQAGHYWSHLTPDLAGEAAGNHSFHVFGVYPWTRFLGRNGAWTNTRSACWTIAASPGAQFFPCQRQVDVLCQKLLWDGRALTLSEPSAGCSTSGPTGTARFPMWRSATRWPCTGAGCAAGCRRSRFARSARAPTGSCG